MQSFFFESPFLLGIVGGFLSAVAIVVWTQLPDAKGQRIALSSALLFSAMTIGLVLLSMWIETDQEKIESTLHRVAAALESNDHPLVYSYIHPNATEGIQHAKGELPRYKFNDARVTRIKEIQVVPDSVPPTAIAEFNVVVNVDIGNNNGRAARFVRVYFMQRDDCWLIRDYEHFEPTAGFRNLPVDPR